jgi:hypothetical protein
VVCGESSHEAGWRGGSVEVVGDARTGAAAVARRGDGDRLCER